MSFDKELLEKILNFPPLYTLQPNQTSRRKQLGFWRDILIYRNVFIFSVHAEIFKNPAISRTLDPKAVCELCNFLISENLGEWTTINEKFLFYRSPLVVWGEKLVYWINESGRANTVETLYSLGHEWHPQDDSITLPIELVYRICKHLEKQNKCEVLGTETAFELVGVKFFQ